MKAPFMRWLGILALSVFAVQFAVLDVCFRGPKHVAALLASTALMTLLASLAKRPVARGLLAIVTGFVVAIDVLYFHYYHDAIDARAVASAMHAWEDVRRVLPGTLRVGAPLVIFASAIEWVLLTAALRVSSSRSRRTAFVPEGVAALVFVAALVGGPPLEDATPELRLAQATTVLFDRKIEPLPGTIGHSVTLPSLASTREALPSVVLILTESVRASDYCLDPHALCDVAPEVHALLPDRVPFRQMRSVASYTVVSFSAILTGHSQEESRATILRSPTVFDVLHAVRAKDTHVTTAYWSAQSKTVFEHEDLRKTIDRFVSVETLVGHAIADEDEVIDRGVDRLLADYVERELPKLPKPFFLVLHFAGTHAPYFVDDAHAPFRPYTHEVTWDNFHELENAYKNAIFEQDRSIARTLRTFRDHTKDDPWAIVFTSDHGEAFGEHKAIHHGFNLYDEQIHVPGFIDGSFSTEERAQLSVNQDAWLTHLDLFPTLLDLYGVHGTFALAPYERTLLGSSLFAPRPSRVPVPLTNCTALFPCPVPTWGVLLDDRLLEAQHWDGDWHCVDLTHGIERENDDARCQQMRTSSKAFFPAHPNGRPNR